MILKSLMKEKWGNVRGLPVQGKTRIFVLSREMEKMKIPLGEEAGWKGKVENFDLRLTNYILTTKI